MSIAAELSLPAKAPAARQILAIIGNRYVAFGPKKALPGRRIFGPADVRQKNLERVADEYDFPSERLVKSIVVEGAKVEMARPFEGLSWDIEINYPDHSKSLVAVKIRTRDFSPREFDADFDWLKQVNSLDAGTAEIWNFNIERLRLTIMWLDLGVWRYDELDPLNVWEFNPDGSAFERFQVIEYVDDWLLRINGLYANVEEWSAGLGVVTNRSRYLRMSEDLMQKFAVADRELAILDVERGDRAVLSFVPFALWIIGARGRIDVVSKHTTAMLLDKGTKKESSNWQVIFDRAAGKTSPWNKDSFSNLLKAAAAP